MLLSEVTRKGGGRCVVNALAKQRRFAPNLAQNPSPKVRVLFTLLSTSTLNCYLPWNLLNSNYILVHLPSHRHPKDNPCELFCTLKAVALYPRPPYLLRANVPVHLLPLETWNGFAELK